MWKYGEGYGSLECIESFVPAWMEGVSRRGMMADRHPGWGEVGEIGGRWGEEGEGGGWWMGGGQGRGEFERDWRGRQESRACEQVRALVIEMRCVCVHQPHVSEDV